MGDAVMETIVVWASLVIMFLAIFVGESARCRHPRHTNRRKHESVR
jgi:hypothetical protein